MASLKQKLEVAAQELVAAKQQLREAQDAWDVLYKQAVGGTKTRKATNTAEGSSTSSGAGEQVPAHTGSATSRIAAVIESDSSKEWGYAQISQRLPDLPKSSIRALLFKLKRDGKAQKVGRGKWKAM